MKKSKCECAAAQQWVVKSPDGTIEIKVMLDDLGRLFYNVSKRGEFMLECSPLGLVTSVSDFSRGMSFVESSESEVNEIYTLPAGKMSQYFNYANELNLKLKTSFQEITLIFRAYNDGVAYRYLIPGTGFIEVKSEMSGFTLPKGELVNVWAQEFHPPYENTYDFRMLEDLTAEHYGMPMLFQVGKRGWMLVSEAAVYGSYCASNIKSIPEGSSTLSLSFAPDQDRPVRGVCPFATPWRVAVIGENLNTIVRSTLIENLNPATEIKDTSWIKPGRSSWPWFTDKESCGSLEANKTYVDFTASMGWEYLLVDAGWEGKFAVEELVRYADAKGVGIFLWAHSRFFRDEDMVRNRLGLWASWGIKGVKIDFFDSDSQNTIAAYDTIAKVAAEFKLMVNYHGSTKPSGEQRRWPHLMTREGILGTEYFGSDWSWSEAHPMGPTAEHNCTIPFTRNAVGPMDYTPVAFTKSRRRTTHAHQLATSVIFESHIQHFCDSKDVYNESLAKEFIMSVPVSWDDTLLLEGYPGRYVTMARKKGSDWFIGAICSVAGRRVKITFDFLDEGTYEATIYEDGTNTDWVKHLNLSEMYKRTAIITKGDTLEIPMKKFGGCAIQLVKRLE